MTHFTKDEQEKIIVWVFKDGSGYQLYPRPTDEQLKNDFIEFKIEYLEELIYKTSIFDESGKLHFVDVPPEPMSCYTRNFEKNKWELDINKKLLFDIEQAKNKKQTLIDSLNQEMKPLELGEKLSDMTADEKQQLLELQKKLIQANRINTDNPERIDWELYSE